MQCGDLALMQSGDFALMQSGDFKVFWCINRVPFTGGKLRCQCDI